MDEYRPPTSLLATPRLPGAPWKAVGLGLLTDVGGTVIAGIVLGSLYAAWLASSGVSEEAIVARVTATPGLSGFGLVQWLVGSTFSVLGGFVCARVSRAHGLRLGWVLGFLTAAIGLATGVGAASPGMSVFGIVQTIGCTVGGMQWGVIVTRREDRATTPDP